MIRLAAHNERRRAWRSAFLLLLPLSLWLTACNQSAQTATTLPRQMAGTWRTDEAKYDGRYMKLDGDRITFGMGGTAADRVELVERVSMTPQDNPTDFAVKLKMPDGSADSINLQYSEKFGGELRLKSQPKIVWSRKAQPVKKQVVAETPAPAPAPEQGPLPTSKHETITRERIYGEHMTIYKIDCLKPNTCKSF
jgi:hypothetical protein